MSAQPAEIFPAVLDLTLEPPLHEYTQILGKTKFDSGYIQAVRQIAMEESHTSRIQRVSSLLSNLDTADSAQFLMAAAKLALRGESAGLRTLFSALNVRQPGVDVLRQLQALSSLERAALRTVQGTWQEPEGRTEENAAFAILEVLEEATRQGVLDLGLEILPQDPNAIRAMATHIRHWYAWMALKLSAKKKLPEEKIHFLVQLSMLEISLMEKRISRLAETIDPYSTRAMARLMPVLSRYDQNIEYMKSVVPQLTTYQPFYDRALTLEVVITETEVNKLQKELLRHPAGLAVETLFAGMRGNPILDREFMFLVSLVHQTGVLRSQYVPTSAYPDVLSSMQLILNWYRHGVPLLVAGEPEVIEEIWPVVNSWGAFRKFNQSLLIQYNESRAMDFIRPDGTPYLPDVPGMVETKELSVEELVRSQMHNDAFLLGVFDNPKAMSKPMLISMIATMSRSVRVLEKIVRTRSLYSGVANKDVPRLLLMNPARLPISSLRKFIHVRFVSKNDLTRMGMSTSDIRPEIKQEIRRYLKTFQN